jgi:hypothetical protein
MNFSSSVVATMGKDFDAIESHPLRRFSPGLWRECLNKMSGAIAHPLLIHVLALSPNA